MRARRCTDLAAAEIGGIREPSAGWDGLAGCTRFTAFVLEGLEYGAFVGEVGGAREAGHVGGAGRVDGDAAGFVVL